MAPTPIPTLKKASSSSQSAKNQTSIAGFFQRKPAAVETALTPAPSSDAPEYEEIKDAETNGDSGNARTNGLPSPITPASAIDEKKHEIKHEAPAGFYSPSRKAKKVVTYAESDGEDDDDEDVFDPNKVSNGRARKRRKVSIESEDDTAVEDDFVAEDDSDEPRNKTKKRKRVSSAKSTVEEDTLTQVSDGGYDLELPTVSTAQTWAYDPEAVQPSEMIIRPQTASKKSTATGSKPFKPKAHTTEPDKRYPWLANLHDKDRHAPDHPDYDPRTVYVPPSAWNGFSPFEKQYWEIKQNFWDTIVFFKKGKFYELYEHDATIGHQLFDLKMTDRVNMRMVGVPEMSLNHWANQFVAKGYKIARVDQQESALGKQMRERDTKVAKFPGKTKIIERKLACVLTRGTLVDGGMLQDEMATYCVAIKQSEREGQPAFGISFVDAATGQFFLTEFIDDLELTKFETFIAQIRPQELLLEKSHVSTEAIRIIKNSVGPTTLWNYQKPGKEFWTADTTCREIDASKYFVSKEGDDSEAWPQALQAAREIEDLMSSFGALVQYLRNLQLERELLTLGNISWYDPIKKASSLVLDGKTLINLEVFANSLDGGSDGTLFALLNRCITPFGKRMFKQWMCHPLMDPAKINARLDAVDSLNADNTVRDQFTSQLARLPDLERMISRVHAGSCRAQDFVRVLEGFEQIDYTISLLRDFGSGEGIIGQLISSMPDMKEILQEWKTAFDHVKGKEDGLLIPERGLETDFDESQDLIESIERELENLLKRTRKELECNAIQFGSNGKEIYQLEVPVKVKRVPKSWDQMSATAKVKRYYNSELRKLVRELQEAQETHGQIVKEVSGRFFARFDEHYEIWLDAVRTIAHLDCLISLAKASSSLGEPCCRPVFIDDERSTIDFEDLRHPCVLPNVRDFISNKVDLGGATPNISLLTGANAAGKSTILRMTCVAVIMAQIGCYVPAESATLTPVDRIMSRLGAQDNIFAAQSTFFVELTETKKILSEATPRSLVILDELGRGTSSFDGVAVAEAVLHHVATHIGCIGFFATHYHSLASEFVAHPEIRNRRMRIHVDDENRQVIFLYKLEDGVAEGSFGMHCARMCHIPDSVVDRAEVAAREWEHTSKLKTDLESKKGGDWISLGWQSDVAWMLREAEGVVDARGLDVLRKAIEGM